MWKWDSLPFITLFIPFPFCPILYLITITEAERPAVFPCPTDKPLTLHWTAGSSTTVAASSTTVTEWPPRLGGHSVHNTYAFRFSCLVDEGLNIDCACIVGEEATNGKKWKLFRGTNRMTWDTTCQTSLHRPSPCLQPTLAIIYREPQT